MEKMFPKKWEALRQAREREVLPAHLLVFLEKILEAREAFMGGPSLPQRLEEKAKIREEGSDAIPLLDRSFFPWEAAARDYFHQIYLLAPSILAQQGVEMNHLPDPQDFPIAEMLGKILQGRGTESELIQRFGPPGSILFFLLAESLRPFLQILAHRFKEQIDRRSWTQGFCPFCGGISLMGELRGEGGQRYLHCSCCSTEWEHPRLKCPFCSNQDQEKLTYFQVEGKEGYRVDVCLQCKKYLKTTDSRERGESPDLEIEDYLTLDLDVLAEREGYHSPGYLFVEAGSS